MVTDNVSDIFPGEPSSLRLDEFRKIYYAMNVTPAMERLVGSLFQKDSLDPDSVFDSASEILAPNKLLMGEGNDLVSELTTFFAPVCVSSCPPVYDENTMQEWKEGIRKYTWEGPLSEAYREQVLQCIRGIFHQQAVLASPSLLLFFHL